MAGSKSWIVRKLPLFAALIAVLWTVGAAVAFAQAPDTFSGSTLAPEPSTAPGAPEKNAATGLSFVGQVTATQQGSTVRLQADRIVNTRASGTSGTLRVELWATSTVPIFGNTITAFTLGSFTLSPLPAGFEYDNVDQTVTFFAPPAGCYYLTMALEEFHTGGYLYEDLVTFTAGGVDDGTGFDRFSYGGVPCTGSTGPCIQDLTTACLLNGRFRAVVRFRNGFDNSPADSTAFLKPVIGFANPSFETAFFYFNSSENIEILLKMLDQGNTNPQGQPTIAVLFGSATPLRCELTITDTQNGAVRTYTSAFNTQRGATDFTAFIK